MPKVKMPRWKTQTLTAPATVAETGSKLPVPDRRSLSFLTAAQMQAISAIASSSPRSPQVFPAGSVVLTSVDDGSVRVITPAQFSTIFETAPEGGGNVRVSSAAATQVNPAGGVFITTNSDGTINVGTAATHVLLRNPDTGEERAVSKTDLANLFEAT